MQMINQETYLPAGKLKVMLYADTLMLVEIDVLWRTLKKDKRC